MASMPSVPGASGIHWSHLAVVRSPDDERLRVHKIGHLVAVEVQRHAHHGVQAVERREIERRSHGAGTDACLEARHEIKKAVVAGTRRDAHRIGPELLGVLGELLGDLVEGLVPRDLFPLALAALAGPAHGVLGAVGVVHAVGMREALRANAVPRRLGQIAHGGADDLAVAHVDVQVAAAVAVAAAGAAEGLVAILDDGRRLALRAASVRHGFGAAARKP